MHDTTVNPFITNNLGANQKVFQACSENSRDVVGVLQNPWFKPGTSARHIEKYKTDYEFRQRVLANSHTGRMLLVGLGPDWFRRIYWTEISFETGNHSGHVSKADLTFIEKEIAGARTVIAFGVHARNALRQIQRDGFRYFECPHPACRLKKSYLSAIAQVRSALEVSV